MRKHPIIYGLVLLVIAGGVFFLFAYVIASLGGEDHIVSMSEKIGVVEITGVINTSKEVIDQLDKYARDDDLKAVVLRIDSPGGAVVPSQEIYDKVRSLKELKKVLVSMGSVAASGGYYIACGADKIIANPGTITGSIGVIIQFPQLKELLQKIGLKSTVIKRGKYKDVGSPSRDMTSEEKALMQAVVDDIYDQFVEAVSLSRNIPKKDVEEIADGRILSGRQALEIGLVDELGNLEYVIDRARALAGIEGEPEVVYPKKKRKGLLYYIIKESISSITEGLESEDTGIRYRYVK